MGILMLHSVRQTWPVFFSVLFAFLFTVSTPGFAQQIKADQSVSVGYRQFDYSFQTNSRSPASLAFKIREDELQEYNNYLPRIDDPRVKARYGQIVEEINIGNRSALQKSMKKLQYEIQSELPGTMELKIKFRDNDFKAWLSYPRTVSKSEADKVMSGIQDRLGEHWRKMNRENAEDIYDHMEDHWPDIIGDDPLAFMLTSGGGYSLQVDYARIANEFRHLMKPLAAAVKQTAGSTKERAVVEHTLSFFQSIPYNNFKTRNVLAGGSFGYVLPTKLLQGNEGDCDSKSTAVAATLLSLVPSRSVIILLIPNHALLGVAIRPQRGDATYKHKNKTYVLMEPTTPGYPVGRIAKFSSGHIAQDNIDSVVVVKR